MAVELKLRRDVEADIDAMTPAEGEPIYDVTNKRLRVGDGSIAGGTPLAVESETATGSTTARSMADRFAEVFNVKDYGAVGDGTTDDAAAIQAAIDAAEAAGGGTVVFPAAIYAIETGLVIDNDGVLLVGDGAGSQLAGGGKVDIRASAATTIKWTGTAGTGTMVQFTSDAADGGGEVGKGGGGISDIFIDGQENALIGLEIETWSHGRFTNVHVGWVRTYGYKFWTLKNNVSLGADDTQHNDFTNLTYQEANTAQNPVGMILGTQNSLNGNFSMNNFRDVQIVMDGTGNGLELENTDTNMFFHVRVGHRLGNSTAKVILHADDTGTLDTDGTPVTTSRYNQFFASEFSQGVTAKATVAGSVSSFGNLIFGLSRGNAAPAPTIEPGADLQFWDSSELSPIKLNVKLDDDGATPGPAINLFRQSTSPADFDALGLINFQGRDSGNNLTVYARIASNILDVTDSPASQDGRLTLLSMQAGTLTSAMEWQNGVKVGQCRRDVGVQTFLKKNSGRLCSLYYVNPENRSIFGAQT